MAISPKIAEAGYVHVWVAPLPKDKIKEFMEILAVSAQVMRDAGALAVIDTVGENVPYGKLTSFPRALMMQENGDEVVWCQTTYYRSRAHSDEIEVKYMADPRIAKLGELPMPYDGKRVFYGGFEVKATG